MNWSLALCFMLKHSKLTFSDEQEDRLKLLIAPSPRLAMMFVAILLITALRSSAVAQNLQAKADDIRNAVDSREFDRAESMVRELRAADGSTFTRNNYDYLLARLLERRGAKTEAS